MANAIKIKKIVELLLSDGSLKEIEVNALPLGVYILSKARGVIKFTSSEEIYQAFQKEREEKNAKRRAALAAKKAEKEEKMLNIAKVQKTGENSEILENAKTLELTEVNSNTFPGVFAKANGEQFMWLPESQVFISMAPLTSEAGDAFLGEKLIGAKSPKDYLTILEAIGAYIPTKGQYDEFASILLKSTGTVTFKGFMKVYSHITFENQLCVDEDGSFRTYLGERVKLDETYAWYNLSSRKILKA